MTTKNTTPVVSWSSVPVGFNLLWRVALLLLPWISILLLRHLDPELGQSAKLLAFAIALLVFAFAAVFLLYIPWAFGFAYSWMGRVLPKGKPGVFRYIKTGLSLLWRYYAGALFISLLLIPLARFPQLIILLNQGVENSLLILACFIGLLAILVSLLLGSSVLHYERKISRISSVEAPADAASNQ